MKKLEVKGVLFDLWNTLIYNIPRAKSLASLVEPLGLEPDQFWRAWRRYMIPSLRGEIKSGEERAQKVLTDLGLPLDMAGQIAQYEQANRGGDVHFFPGVPEMLDELKQRGYRVAIVSNTNYVARPVVEQLQIREKVDDVILSCEVGLLKPDPEIYRLGASRLGLEAHDCLFVGDGGDNELDGAITVGCRVAVVQQERGFAYRNPGNFPAEVDLQLPNVIDVLSYL
jgi:putative hydrolase of the HAD superfamily